MSDKLLPELELPTELEPALQSLANMHYLLALLQNMMATHQRLNQELLLLLELYLIWAELYQG
jgi:hypothetical protein